MWIMLNDAFLSIVEAHAEGLNRAGIAHRDPKDWLCVRARKAEHITRVFPRAEVLEWTSRDYAARAFVTRYSVEAALLERVRRIDYSNFKNSVKDRALHDAYLQVWNDMWDYQHGDEPETQGTLPHRP